MPGLVGFSKKHMDGIKAKSVLQKMQNLITHYNFYAKDDLFYDDFISATRVHTNIIQKQPQPYCENGVYVWLDGEFYNKGELKAKYGITADTDPELLAGLYNRDNKFSFLKSIDGLYSIVLYDLIRKKLFLITDRYGLRHLYFMVKDNAIVWGSEVKVMLAFPNFHPIINKQSVEQFFGIGYLLENNTWFENVELVPSGTVLSWDLINNKMSNYRYWWWDEIKPITGKLNETEIVSELGRIFDDAVKRRCRKEERVGLMLSGGLDSRAILSAMPVTEYPTHAVTFGQKGCDDVKIAAMAAHIKGAHHHVYELTQANWLQPRINGVWLTDGQMDLMHMHGIEGLNSTKDLFDVNLNGFAGDLILGGSYLKRTAYFDSEINESQAVETMDCERKAVNNLEIYRGLRKTDYYFIQNRVRRFTSGGPKYLLSLIEDRKPFFDNKLIELAYSLPDSYRFNSYIYKEMLLRQYPGFYKNIPWQRTGMPIGLSNFSSFLVSFNKKTIRRLSAIGLQSNSRNNYTDYPKWIREEPAKSFFQQILSSLEALYRKYIPYEQVISDLNDHFGGKDRSVNLCRYLTFEIWLQQVIKGDHRD